MTRLVAGTRGSPLALRQVELVSQALTAAINDVEIETRVIRTEGDRRQDVSLETMGGQGVFVKDIEQRLLAGEIDFAVHSLKDVPAELPPGLTIAAVLPRGDVRDVLVSRYGNLSALPQGAIIGTDSRRRVLQLQRLRPDLQAESVRGNVETRIQKAESGGMDGVVLALAGLERLRLQDRATQIFSVEEIMPAVAQAAIAIECREDDTRIMALLSRIDDEETHAAVRGERAYLQRLGAGCRLPVAAYGRVAGGMLQLKGMIATDDGRIRRYSVAGPVEMAEGLGWTLADTLLQWTQEAQA